MVVENEISYSINLSQDLLYIILESYIVKKFKASEEYFDFVDENNTRSRYDLTRKRFSNVYKNCASFKKFVYADNNVLVPFVDRISTEEIPDQMPTDNLKRITKCIVYQNENCPQCEIKFEHTYFNRNLVDSLDSLMASKQIVLLNLLQNKKEPLVKQSHLGSDEILASLRLEYEYQDKIDSSVLKFMSCIVHDIDNIASYQKIRPSLPYTTMQNHIIYRKFTKENTLTSKSTDDITNIYRWALKLDGIRGKGIMSKYFVIVFMDDMQMFSGSVNSPFALNNVVAFQCELLDNVLYITDILHVFKYLYNNRTQYECSLEPYDIDPASAIETINNLAKTHNNGTTDGLQTNLFILTMDQQKILIKFQSFHLPPVQLSGYTTIATDGFIVLDTDMKYVKYKYQTTVEVEYDATKNVFKTLDSELLDYKITVDSQIKELRHGEIYEAVIEQKHLQVIKSRRDRLIPN
ncbi:LEF-4 [Chrysodeixis includens nucleopolyhedrovirus]|uniref:LEF-4 n=1 Tax=Chrysodeixis includens nucleopolyhedrovirus TaxID=1207438 RepID=A0A5B8YTY5_9ABAC|nr:LEF-4 [Chrysodeixis includens nucleopolyhedrovirus]QED40601.1 LEF-4 [Chrysodeixis includens nucleopolyhedrovirus]